MRRIRFQLTEDNVSYVSVSIPYSEELWDKILNDYVTMVSPPLPVQMAEAIKSSPFGQSGRDGLD